MEELPDLQCFSNREIRGMREWECPRSADSGEIPQAREKGIVFRGKMRYDMNNVKKGRESV